MQPSELYDPEISKLVAHLYDAAVDDSLWPGTAARIAETFAASSTVVKLHGGGARIDLLECTANLLISEREQAWAEDWHRRDLWVERSVAYGMSQIITDEDLVTREEQEFSGFYQEWLPRLDIHHMLGAVFPTADGVIGVLGVHRPLGAEAYTAAERRRAGLLLPHLQGALRLGRRFAEARQNQDLALQALDRLDTGVLLVDASGRILHASAMAEALMRSNAEIGVVGGRLSLRPTATHDKLSSMIRNAMDTAQGKISAPGLALAVPRHNRTPLTLEAAPLRPSLSAFGAQQPCVLILIRDPEAPLAVDRLRSLFGLTRTEGAVAAALGCGDSLEDIAADLCIGLATARSHLKRILAKTGTHRQAEAVALLGRSLSTAADQ